MRSSISSMALLASFLVFTQGLFNDAAAADKVKIRGYVTAASEPGKVMILDDVIQLAPGVGLEWDGANEEHNVLPSSPQVGFLIEAEGTWEGKHRFRAVKITADADVVGKVLKEKAFIMHVPTDAAKIGQGDAAQLKLDGEILDIGANSHRSWPSQVASPAAGNIKSTVPEARYLGMRAEYKGARQPDGSIAVQSLELSAPAPPDAYKIPGDITAARGKDPKTSAELIEFRKGKNIQGRLKLFPVQEVQDYIHHLGLSLIPGGNAGTSVGIEFRFFVIEQSSVNASAMPDGTIMVHTGLLGACENEAQLAFVLSHEISHVLQAHYWRQVTETRTKRVLITIAAIAGSYYIGDLANFLGAIGLEALVNGYSRRMEDQADRIAIQNLIELGYDPRQGSAFSKMLIDRYSMRSISKVFSTHNSPVMRGSFLTVQLSRQYPQSHFDNAKVNTEAFMKMKEAMGPVKIE